MSFTHWLSNRLGLSSRSPGLAPRPASKRRARPAQRAFRPCLECLEDRCVPSTLFVTDGEVDSATVAGTLRWAVANANNGDTIIVQGQALGTGITLQDQLVLTQQGLTIEGKSQATITETGADRILSVSPLAQVTLSNLALSGGNGVFKGGGIYNDGTLNLSACTVSGNSAAAHGGGIFNASDGTLTVTNSTLSANGRGGGIGNVGTATSINSILSPNS